jgi:hypothetical protein
MHVYECVCLTEIGRENTERFQAGNGAALSLCARMREGSISGRCVNARAKAAAAAGHAEEGTGKREAASNAFAYGEERREREAGRGMHALKEGLDQFPALIIATQWRTGHPWNDVAFNFARRQLSASAAAACMVVFAMVPCQKGASQNAGDRSTLTLSTHLRLSPQTWGLSSILLLASCMHAWIDSLRTYRQTLQSPTCMHETITDVSLSPSLLPAPLVCVSL